MPRGISKEQNRAALFHYNLNEFFEIGQLMRGRPFIDADERFRSQAQSSAMALRRAAENPTVVAIDPAEVRVVPRDQRAFEASDRAGDVVDGQWLQITGKLCCEHRGVGHVVAEAREDLVLVAGHADTGFELETIDE